MTEHRGIGDCSGESRVRSVVIDCGGPEHSAQLLHVDARYMVAKNRTKRVQAPMISPAIYLMTPKVETAIEC